MRLILFALAVLFAAAVLGALAMSRLAAPAAAQESGVPGANPGAIPGTDAGETEPAAGPALLEASAIAGEIRLDGVLDEPAWAGAQVADGFRQQEPDEARPATYPTEVRVLFSPTTLYIGARLEDPEPRRLIARILERDQVIQSGGFGGPTSNDDAFLVVLDSYDDDRNGFVFATNPNGAEADALLRNESDLNLDWDAVWSVVSSVDGGGWTAEIAIPFWSLRFSESGAGTWGVNFQRVLKRRNETDLWRSWTRDNGGLLKVSQAGSLLGLSELQQGLNLQLKPFALAEGRGDGDLDGPGPLEGGSEGSLDAGLDAKFGVTPNLTLDATLNTDFAQVEADIRQINLTRFSLFFPEKREFFLEGAGIFTFGVPGFGGPPSALLFFSRRVGLQGVEEVPILGGVKLTGKEGPWSLGALDVLTGEASSVPATNFTVARVQRDLGARSTLGAIVTQRAELGEGSSEAVGVDTHVQFSQKLVFDGFAAATGQARDENAAYRAALDFTADQWGWLVEQSYLGPAFDPALGFVLRGDVNRQFGTFRVTPRPEALGIRRIDLRVSATLVSSGDWEIRDRNYRFSATPQLHSGDGLELAVEDDFVRLPNPFELAPGLVLPVDDYPGTSYDAYLFTSRNRPVSAELRAGRFAFFSGRNARVASTVRVAAGRHASLEATWTHNEIRTPDGDLTTNLANVRVNYALSTRLFTSALLQYDSLTDELDLNVRVNFIHSPGSDLFLVLNERRGDSEVAGAVRSRAVILKLTKLFNL